MSENSLIVNPLLLSEEQFQTIEDLAACNYSPAQIATLLEVGEAVFAKMCFDPETEIYRRYQKGILQSSFDINQKLLENARKGNITAAQQFEKNREAVKIENLKQKFFG